MKLQFNRDGWTDWIQHDHKGCPVVGYYVRLETECLVESFPAHYRKVGPKVLEGVPRKLSGKSWCGGNKDYTKVVRYKVRKPKGLQSLQDILEKIPVDISNESGYKELNKQKQGA